MNYIDELTINEELTILEVMKKLDLVARKVVFIIKEQRLIATVTDGDIRRWILKGGSLDSQIKNVANYQPKYLYEREQKNALSYMKQQLIEALPIVDENHHIVNIVFLNGDDLIKRRNQINAPVVIMAGGLGTRLYPYTKILPKPLIPIGEIPIVEHIMNRFYEYGCRDYYMIVNHKRNMIKAYFNEISLDYNINYVDEQIPLGTGGGLSLLKGKISSTFLLTNCDILINEDIDKIYEYHKINNNLITMVVSLKNFTIPYGVVDISADGTIGAMREKPVMSFFTNTGCYVVEPRVVDELADNTNVGFPDIIEEYKHKGEKIGVYPISEGAWLDMGQLEELENMKKRLNLE